MKITEKKYILEFDKNELLNLRQLVFRGDKFYNQVKTEEGVGGFNPKTIKERRDFAKAFMQELPVFLEVD